MKKLLLPLMASALLLGAPQAFAAETYALDSDHTNIVWSISHFGFSHPSGKFTKATGTLVLDEAAPEQSRVSVALSPANVMTGIEKLDEHLKSKDFFDVAAYPDARFESTKVELLGLDKALVTGTLTLHGVSKPLTLHVALNKIGENMFKKKTAGFSATATLKRSDYGIVTYLPGLGDDVTLTIETEANLAP